MSSTGIFLFAVGVNWIAFQQLQSRTECWMFTTGPCVIPRTVGQAVVDPQDPLQARGYKGKSRAAQVLNAEVLNRSG